jgi:DNA polymerase-3 subunit delta
MRLNLTQLNTQVTQGLKPAYLLTGDEPLQLGEAADTIRLAAKQANYLNREIFTVEGQFNWNQVLVAMESVSVFADQKIIDLRVPSAKFGLEGSKIITAYCQRASSHTLLLISTAKLARTALKSRWVQAIEKIGIVLQVWPLTTDELINWLQKRLLTRGLQLELTAIKLLAASVEGNLLAANQEIEKLYMYYGAGTLTTTQVQTVLTDSTRFNVFNLTDAVLSQQVNRTLKILHSLRAEGIVAPVILWALTRELRCLFELKTATNKVPIFKKYQVWDTRKSIINKALIRLTIEEIQQACQLSATADRQIKGQQLGDYWDTLLAICLSLASVKMPFPFINKVY